MDLSKLRLAEGVSIAIYLGDTPVEAWVVPTDDGDVVDSNTQVEDPVVITVRYFSKLITRLVVPRRMWGNDDPDLIQFAIDQALEKDGRPPLVDPDHPSGPRLVP